MTAVNSPAAVIPEPVLHQLYRAYCLCRFHYPPDVYVSSEARERHIDGDARSYYKKDHTGSLAELVEAAYRAGAEAALGGVMAVRDDGTSVEWGVRYGDDDTVVTIWDDDDDKPEQIARQKHDGTTRIAVRRRVTAWEAVNSDA